MDGGWVRDAYPGSTWDPLAAIIAWYNPLNLFRRNQNIPLAVESDSVEPINHKHPARAEDAGGERAMYETTDCEASSRPSGGFRPMN